jgi:hypothetical protein
MAVSEWGGRFPRGSTSHRVNPGQLNGVWLGEMDLMNRVHTQASPGGSGVACGGWPGGLAWQGLPAIRVAVCCSEPRFWRSR